MTALGGVRVLHVDDEPDFADLAADMLERNDARFTVEIATSAGEGLDRLAGHEFDCVVSDYDMPGMDGIEFLERVREEYPDLPFILFTGKGSEEIATEAISAGVTHYVQKRPGSEQYELLANRIKNAVEQHRSRRRVARQRQEYQQLFEQAPVMFAVFRDEDGEPVVTGCNERFAGNLGYDSERVRGMSVRELYTEESVAQAVEGDGFQRALAGEFTTEERTLHTKGGDTRDVLVRAVPRTDATGAVTGTLALYVDITERKESQRELQEIRERMEFTLDGTDSVIYDVDLDEYEETRHGPFERLYGLDPEEYSQTSEFYDAAIHPEDREKMRVFEQTETLRDRDTVEWEYRTHPDRGEVRWLYSIADIRSGPDGEPTRAFGLVTDVTERKERERELERQNDRLDEFASIVSHDIRNPLSMASSQLDLAREECDSPHLEEVARWHGRMEQLIDDLLALAREGESVAGIEPVDLADVAGQCWEDIGAEEATLVTDTTATVSADPGRLRQLVENLVSNAVKHGGDDVTVTVGDLDEGFYVADDGPGIAADERDRALESGYTTAEDGTGFGLSIVRRIAEAHGWKVRITDSDDGGARFEIAGVEIID